MRKSLGINELKVGHRVFVTIFYDYDKVVLHGIVSEIRDDLSFPIKIDVNNSNNKEEKEYLRFILNISPQGDRCICSTHYIHNVEKCLIEYEEEFHKHSRLDGVIYEINKMMPSSFRGSNFELTLSEKESVLIKIISMVNGINND